jgi:small subunit ribosomal protein S18
MARNTTDRRSRRVAKDPARRPKKKPCLLCREKVEWVDYKDVGLLRKFMSDRGKIRARRVTGNCSQHQRDVAVAIKTARELVLLPYTQRTVTERSGAKARAGRAGRGAAEATAPAEAVVEAEEAAIEPGDAAEEAADEIAEVAG